MDKYVQAERWALGWICTHPAGEAPTPDISILFSSMVHPWVSCWCLESLQLNGPWSDMFSSRFDMVKIGLNIHTGAELWV
jgi:hypothetical protein